MFGFSSLLFVVVGGGVLLLAFIVGIVCGACLWFIIYNVDLVCVFATLLLALHVWY